MGIGATEGEHVPAAPLPAGHVSGALTPRDSQRGWGCVEARGRHSQTGCARTRTHWHTAARA